MNKIFTAMALAFGLVAMPSFAQLGSSLSSFEPASVDGVHRRPHNDPPPPPPRHPEPHRDHGHSIISPDSPVRIGGRLAVGIGDADGMTHVNVDVGGALHVLLMPMIYLAPEVNFSVRNYSKTYGSDRYYGYYYEFEDNFTQLLVDIPVLARFQPIPFIFFESGFKLGVNLASMYSDDYVCYYSKYDSEVLDRGSYDVEEWEANPINFSFVLGAGGTVRSGGRWVDVGIRFVFDLNSTTFDYVMERGGKRERNIVADGHPWSLQFQATYLL